MAKRGGRRKLSLGIKLHAYLYWFLGLTAVVIVGIIVWNNKAWDLPCANSISCIKDLSGEVDPSQKQGIFMGKTINIPQDLVSNLDRPTEVLGETSSNKHIYIDLSNQKLIAKEGDRTIFEFLISSGKWGRTPTGDFTIWIKLQATRMVGGNKAIGTYYNLPNVPYTMYFYNSEIPKSRGYGVHGAYWHNNFGHPMSHGCINMKPEEARLLYDWANPPAVAYTTYASADSPGTPITIYGTAPWN